MVSEYDSHVAAMRTALRHHHDVVVEWLAQIDRERQRLRDGGGVHRGASAERHRDALNHAEHMLAADIERMRRALDHLESGHYGQCMSCGRDIGELHLRKVPDAIECPICATRSGRPDGWWNMESPPAVIA